MSRSCVIASQHVVLLVEDHGIIRPRGKGHAEVYLRLVVATRGSWSTRTSMSACRWPVHSRIALSPSAHPLDESDEVTGTKSGLNSTPVALGIYFFPNPRFIELKSRVVTGHIPIHGSTYRWVLQRRFCAYRFFARAKEASRDSERRLDLPTRWLHGSWLSKKKSASATFRFLNDKLAPRISYVDSVPEATLPVAP